MQTIWFLEGGIFCLFFPLIFLNFFQIDLWIFGGRRAQSDQFLLMSAGAEQSTGLNSTAVSSNNNFKSETLQTLSDQSNLAQLIALRHLLKRGNIAVFLLPQKQQTASLAQSPQPLLQEAVAKTPVKTNSPY